MNLVTSILAISIAVVLYMALIEFFTALFRITGLTKEKARFQVISMITCAGFTTSESEIITTNRGRRRLAITCMITGTLFNVVIISLIINLLSTISNAEILKEQIIMIAVILGVLLFIIIFVNIPFISKRIQKISDFFARKIMLKKKGANILTMLDSYDKDAIAEIYINNIPDILKNKTLMESNFKSQYNINLLILKRGDRTIDVTRDTVIQNKDRIIVFGNKQTIKDLFSYKLDEKYEEEIINAPKENILTLIDNYGTDAMAEVEIHILPEILRDKKLFESPIKTKYNLNVLMIKRDDNPIPVTKDSTIELNDTIVIFGNYNSIKTIFLEPNNSKETRIDAE